MKNKVKLLILGVLILFMTGCLSENDKIEIITKELNNKYNKIEMIDNYSYSNENGDDELYSIIKINDEYELVYSNYHNDKLDKYEEVKVSIVDYNKDDRFIEANVYNNGEYLKQDNVLIFDTSKLNRDEIRKIVFNKAMNQYMADLKDNNINIYLKVRFVSSLTNNMDSYKKMLLASTYSRCPMSFYDKYYGDTNIIGGGFGVLIHSASREISYDEITTSIEEDFNKLDKNYNYVKK